MLVGVIDPLVYVIRSATEERLTSAETSALEISVGVSLVLTFFEQKIDKSCQVFSWH